MLIDSMSHVDFDKWPFHHNLIEFKGQGPYVLSGEKHQIDLGYFLINTHVTKKPQF